jgi:hypothetical protein
LPGFGSAAFKEDRPALRLSLRRWIKPDLLALFVGQFPTEFDEAIIFKTETMGGLPFHIDLENFSLDP